ncbi:putative nucleotidyltransferase substrate binding domain-containing protein [Corynebacterium pseudopelargi]|uniref:Arabinose 5-phosphate isomerase KdsD n=1 Tax=Corynebacterium pseudopelargi TaxID=2080757 RepID=A0A3G6IUY6_9CORY|nr:putative nucleotidyltransferase substrate binding domain-containing protein [Corynebacterium pseudopelargi]AZA09416.1 Arabinose 5-phosphate isomerase KdsD [Corynebacterium pseudopelargi]
MSVELQEVHNFLAEHAPFAQLSHTLLAPLPQACTMRYVRAGETVVALDSPNDYCFIIRSGAVDVLDQQGVLLDRRDAGRCFGYSTILGENRSRYQMVAVEDSLLLLLPREAFLQVAQQDAAFERFFSSQSKRMSAAAQHLRSDSSSELLRTPLEKFMIRDAATVGQVSIREAAQVMTSRNVSSLLITQDGKVRGIVTDRDLRSKVVAQARDPHESIERIATIEPVTARAETSALEAMLTMTELGIHHLPVVDEQELLIGIVSAADIMRLLRNDPMYITADISSRQTPEELAQAYSMAHDVALRFIERGAGAEAVSGVLTLAADGIARRLCTLAEEELGPPPVPYAFVVAGSQARKGMGLASDQDNCLVLSDEYQDEHNEYFEALSQRVCSGLDAAGQVLCPGDMMASNPQWRMTRRQWIDTFQHWITAPEPDALLHAQTFFDFRAIHGASELAKEVHSEAIAMAQTSKRLHAHLATLAARREPPLGFFRGFVVERSGEHVHQLDLKKGGIYAVTQLARLFAVAGGIDQIATRQRLQLAGQVGSVSERGAQDLIDAFEFLSTIALRHQAAQIRAGQRPDYHVDPNALKKLDREHLRDAFQIIKNMQNALSTKYPIRNI